MDPEHIRKIKQWVEYDNALIQYKHDIKDTSERKKELEESITKYIESQKLDKLVVNITDGCIKFGRRNVTQPLSMKTLRSILQSYAMQHQSIDVDEIIKFVGESLEVKLKTTMTREFSKLSCAT